MTILLGQVTVSDGLPEVLAELSQALEDAEKERGNE